jgi:hypothetical protein
MGMRKQQAQVYDLPAWWRGRQCLEFHSGIWLHVQWSVLLWSLDSSYGAFSASSRVIISANSSVTSASSCVIISANSSVVTCEPHRPVCHYHCTAHMVVPACLLELSAAYFQSVSSVFSLTTNQPTVLQPVIFSQTNRLAVIWYNDHGYATTTVLKLYNIMIMAHPFLFNCFLSTSMLLTAGWCQVVSAAWLMAGCFSSMKLYCCKVLPWPVGTVFVCLFHCT